MNTTKFSKLKGTIQQGNLEINDIKTKSTEFQKLLTSAMEDEVGYYASQSNNSIERRINNDLNDGYYTCNQSVSSLSDGDYVNKQIYNQTQEILKQAEKLYQEILEFEKSFPG